MTLSKNSHSRGPFISRRLALSRRSFLRAAGVAMALPMLDSMSAPFARSVFAADATAVMPTGAPRRLFAVCNNLGLLHEPFFPKDSGKNYTLSPYLELLKEHR